MDFAYEIWKDKLTPAIASAIKAALPHMARVVVKHNDPAEPCPCVAWISKPLPDDHIGVRIRQWEFYDSHGDVTFRADRQRPIDRSEVETIIAGWGRYYLYGWATDDGDMKAWLILDLDVIREKKVLQGQPLTSRRRDGAEFVSMSVTELYLRGCIIASELPERAQTGQSREARSDR